MGCATLSYVSSTFEGTKPDIIIIIITTVIIMVIYVVPSRKSPECLQRQKDTLISSHTHARARARRLTHTRVRTYTRTHTHARMHTRTHTHTHTHTMTHARTHERTHTHTHTHTLQIHALLVMGWYNEKKTTDQYAVEGYKKRHPINITYFKQSVLPLRSSCACPFCDTQ